MISTTEQHATAVSHERAPEVHELVQGEIADLAFALIASRQNVSPRRLIEPGPDAAEMASLFDAAAAAPDHGMRTPWRFVVVPQNKRALLGDAYAHALVDRDPGATAEDIRGAREKALRAPLLVLAVARCLSNDGGVRDVEVLVSLGCAIQNMLLAAHALGFGGALTSGQAMTSRRLRELFRLTDDEQAVCFLNFGAVSKRKPLRARPTPAAFTSTL